MLRILLVISILLFSQKIYGADTNTVSSTVVTDKSVPTANAPSVVVNNSDICKVATSGAIQTNILGIATGVVVDDELCQLLKLSRQLYASGLKVASAIRYDHGQCTVRKPARLCHAFFTNLTFKAMSASKTYC